MSTPPRLFIGIDAGGTKTALLALSDTGGPPLSLAGPAANLQRAGAPAVARVLADLIDAARARFPDGAAVSCCAGVAGAGRPEDRDALARELEGLLPTPLLLSIRSDADLALEAAFGAGSGMVVIAGTGSMVLARSATGATHRAGGWGYLLGDEGGGYAIGRDGLRAVARAFDGGPPTQLGDLLARTHDIASAPDLIAAVYRDGLPPAQVAPLVLEAAAAADASSLSILRQHARDLAQQAAWLAVRAPDVAPRLALLGGLTRDALYFGLLTDAFAALLPAWPLTRAPREPVEAALALAFQQSGAPTP